MKKTVTEIEKAEALKKNGQSADPHAAPDVTSEKSANVEEMAIEKAEAPKEETQKEEAESSGLEAIPDAMRDNKSAGDGADAGSETDTAGDGPPPIPGAAPFPPEFEVSDNSTIFMGLRVYTDRSGGAATVVGQLRYEMVAEFSGSGAEAA